MVFDFMESVTFNTFRSMSTVYKSCVPSFLTILVLGNIWVHICSSNSHNVMSNVKAFINEIFCFGTTLEVPNINSNHSHVRFGKSFNNLEIWCKNGVFKYVSTFNYCFYDVYSNRKISIFNEVEYIYFSMVFISEVDATLFVVMIPLLLE